MRCSGIGLTLIFGIMSVVNFTHGELYAFGAYIDVHRRCICSGLNFFLALPLAIVAGCVLGALIEIVLLRPMRGADIDTTMLVMIGAMDRHAECRAVWIWGGVAKSVDDAVSRSAAGDRAGLGVLAAAVRVRRGAGADRCHLSPDQPHQARQGDARDLPGSRHRRADGRQHPARSTPRRSRSARALPRRPARCSGRSMSISPQMGDLAVAQGVRDRHPRRPRQHHRRDDRRLHPGLRGGDGRRLHLLGLSRRDGLPAHHRGAAVQADRAVRATERIG